MSEKKIVHELELEKDMKVIVTVFRETVCVELVDPIKELTCVNYFKLDAAKKLGELLSSL